jgi:WD40 repeat protein
LLARQAVAVDDTPQTRGYLLAALQRGPAVIGIMHGGTDEDLRRIALSPDGKTLAVAGLGGAGIRFFDAETYEQIGEPVDVPTAPYGAKDVLGLAYSPDGRTLAFAAPGDFQAFGYLRVIDVETREVLAEARSTALDVTFTRDGSLLVLTEYGFGYGDLMVTFRDPTTLARVGDTIQLGIGDAPADVERAAYAPLLKVSPFVALTPDGGSVVIASPDGELAWRDLESREQTRALAITEGYHAVALSQDGLTAALGIDGGIQLVDLQSGNVQTASRDLTGEPQWLLFSRDSKTVVSTGLDGTVTLWDVETATPRETLRGHSASVGQPVFSQDGATLYTASDDGTAIAWDIDGSRRLGRPFRFTHDGAYHPLSDRHPGKFSPDGRLIAVGLEEQGIALWDAFELTSVGTPLRETGGEVKALAFSPDGRTLAAVTREGRATVWDVKSRSLRRGPFYVEGLVVGVSFSADGTMLATAGQQGVRLWDVETGAQLGTIGDGTPPDDVAFSPTGPLVAFVVDEWAPVAGRRDTIAHAELWDVAQRSRIARVEVNAGAPDRDEGLGYTLAFSPDGRVLAIGGDDPLVHLWDVRTGRLVRELEQDVGGVQALDFSSDGRILAISGRPDASLWDLTTGTHVGRLSGGSRRAMLDLSADGRSLLMTSANGQGTVSDIDPESWKQRACALANRTLTREEWNEFLPGRAYEPACAA